MTAQPIIFSASYAYIYARNHLQKRPYMNINKLRFIQRFHAPFPTSKMLQIKTFFFPFLEMKYCLSIYLAVFDDYLAG